MREKEYKKRVGYSSGETSGRNGLLWCGVVVIVANERHRPCSWLDECHSICFRLFCQRIPKDAPVPVLSGVLDDPTHQEQCINDDINMSLVMWVRVW